MIFVVLVSTLIYRTQVGSHKNQFVPCYIIGDFTGNII